MRDGVWYSFILLPARAGMIPAIFVMTMMPITAPRTRGDDPTQRAINRAG